MARRLGCAILLIAFLGVAILGGNFIWGWTGEGPAEEEISFILPEGSSLAKAAELLEEAGAVRSADAFLNRAKLLGSNDPIKAGEFVIPAGASNSDILAILQGNDFVLRLVAIPEGMPSIVVHETLMAEPLLTGEIEVPEEGSVLPESYSFERGESRAAVLKRMQDAMDKTLADLWKERASNIAVSTPQEAIILASIVEKETGVPKERRTVAGLYSNRLKRDMMLQADPTVIYPVTKGKPLGRRILRSELNAVNDYNTYTSLGLPIGPITNPGQASIAAVLNPANTSAIYMVADGSGGHVFADTLEEHNRNVERWFAIRRQRGEM
ncbi:endolytic transglycosylase MltG [Alterisphingorhabdus coralli]|uniref:Endolytic murein transglycosylase n=1 Tax=Alterisphingorhabdus coralli TaxID=3071408 RepID=A0AA97FBG0_9SPHN|nr:endolytic transglycosylase MltG [Parasphingorhabdus sp. SCSIO 66989]WOE76572.1 endolytic transglycosylase MltG [Parasphingorhabdus sp. SCSIO 66989]